MIRSITFFSNVFFDVCAREQQSFHHYFQLMRLKLNDKIQKLKTKSDVTKWSQLIECIGAGFLQLSSYHSVEIV